MGSDVAKLQGFEARGGEVAAFNPKEIFIVGIDEPLTAENWFAFCPRVKEPIDEAFLEDIRQNGVRMSLDGYRDGNRIGLLDGRRRLRHARIVRDEQDKARIPVADRIKVRVTIRRGEHDDLYSYNVGSFDRKELTPEQRALMMQNYQKYGHDNAQTARKFSCDERTVTNTLAILDCANEVRADFNSGVLPCRLAPQYAKETRERQLEMRKEQLAAGATKGAAADNAVRAMRAGNKVAAPDHQKLLSGGFVKRWDAALDDVKETKAVEVGRAVIKFMFGHKNALNDYPELKEAAVAAGLKAK